MTLDLAAIRARALALRDVQAPSKTRSEALYHASDDLLALCREVEQLRAASSPEAAELAKRLAAIRLIPVDVGPLSDLAHALCKGIYDFAVSNAGHAGKAPTWDTAAMHEAIRILKRLNTYLQAQLSPPPSSPPASDPIRGGSP